MALHVLEFATNLATGMIFINGLRRRADEPKSQCDIFPEKSLIGDKERNEVVCHKGVAIIAQVIFACDKDSHGLFFLQIQSANQVQKRDVVFDSNSLDILRYRA